MQTGSLIQTIANRLPRDPRRFQVAALGALLAFGQMALDIGVDAINCLLLFAATLGTQVFASRCVGLARIDLMSALITGLSLSLILRTDVAVLAFTAGVVAIAGKFLLRIRDKHLFNPANLAIVLLVLSSDRAWISTGQWGSAAIAALAVAGIGLIVITRARRIETTLAFLVTYAALLVGRAAWLGDPMTIPAHQLQNGALLIFAFFMISDPKTTPDSASGRLLYGSVVAIASLPIQFVLFLPGAPLLALFACSPLVPLIDWWLRAPAYAWVPWHSPYPRKISQGDSHASIPNLPFYRCRAAVDPAGQRILRFLRRKSRRKPVQPGLEGRARARR